MRRICVISVIFKVMGPLNIINVFMACICNSQAHSKHKGPENCVENQCIPVQITFCPSCTFTENQIISGTLQSRDITVKLRNTIYFLKRFVNMFQRPYKSTVLDTDSKKQCHSLGANSLSLGQVK
jgi:hypothetical protein